MKLKEILNMVEECNTVIIRYITGLELYKIKMENMYTIEIKDDCNYKITGLEALPNETLVIYVITC